VHIIPVIDIKDGLVVSAKQGLRDTYLPIRSALCKSSSVESVLNGILSVYAFKIIYIADLNAIANSGDNQELIDKLVSQNKVITFWVDSGVKIEALPNLVNAYYKPIIGSESQKGVFIGGVNFSNSILSLDFFPEQGYKGPKELIENAGLWSQQIIIMTLDRVGNNTGPDFEKLNFFREKYPSKDFVAAGGVRNEIDLINLKKIGINYALIASSLHSGEVTKGVITRLQVKKCPE